MKYNKNYLLLFFSVLISYLLLVIGDWYINRVTNKNIENHNFYTKSKKIENERIKNEDIPQAELAIKDGYRQIVYPALIESLDYPLIGGLPLTKTYFCNEGYGLIRYHSDRFGFRNNDSDWDLKNKSMIIGDSFVQGACVITNQTITSYMTQFTNEVHLNMGMGANNPLHYLTYGYLFIPKIKPNKVYLVFYSANKGVFPLNPIYKRYVANKNKLFSENKIGLADTKYFIDEGLEVIKNKTNKYKIKNNEKRELNFKNFINKLLYLFKRHLTLPSIRGLISSDLPFFKFKITENTIRQTQKLCILNNCDLYVVYIPNSIFWRPDSLADQYGDSINELSKKLGIKFIDGRDVIDRSEGSKDYSIKGPHLSPSGYKKISNYIYNHIN